MTEHEGRRAYRAIADEQKQEAILMQAASLQRNNLETLERIHELVDNQLRPNLDDMRSINEVVKDLCETLERGR